MSAEEIVPDTKDWTWVLERPCPECGFDAAAVEVDAIGPAVRESLPRWKAVLSRPDATVRPDAATWSPSEYAAHVRDVFGIFEGRLRMLLDQDDPLFPDWDQDKAAVDGDYASLTPADIALDLEPAGEKVAARFDAVAPDQVDRPGRRSNGSVFTVRTLGRYFLHDLKHHLHDVGA